MSITINLGVWDSVFAVPTRVVDEGLKFADGAKLRVLLYILRNSGKTINENDISKATNVSPTDIPEVLDYWIQMGVIAKNNDEYTPAKSENTESYISKLEINNDVNSVLENKTIIEDKEQTKENSKPHFTVSKLQKPDYAFTAERLAVDEELQFLVEETQSSLGKVLSNSDISALLALKDQCGLPLDVILMLIQYCVSIDKANMHTINKVGVQWANDGIYSLEAADNKIMQIRKTSKNFSIVSSAFGLKNVGSPTKKQLEYGDKWIGEWKFSPQMLREAYERCVDTKGSMNFRYIDGILKRWNSANVHTMEDLHSFEKSTSTKNANQKSSYDIDELEKIEILDNI